MTTYTRCETCRWWLPDPMSVDSNATADQKNVAAVGECSLITRLPEKASAGIRVRDAHRLSPLDQRSILAQVKLTTDARFQCLDWHDKGISDDESGFIAGVGTT